MKKRILAFVIALSLPVLLGTPAFAASSKNHQVHLSSRPGFMRSSHRHGKVAGVSALTSGNWSGYAVTGSNGAYNSISSAWTQPAVNCTGLSKNTYSAYWVGLDGFSNSTVEQIGTEADCSRTTPVYGAWYEMYPSNPYEVRANLTIHAGDQMSAAVKYQPSVTTTTTTTVRGRTRTTTTTTKASYLLTLSDATSGKSYSTTVTPNRTYARASAEVVTEAPYSGGVLPLANYSTVNYTDTLVNGSPMGGLPNLQDVIMQNPSGMVSTPSTFDASNETFSTTWSAS